MGFDPRRLKMQLGNGAVLAVLLVAALGCGKPEPGSLASRSPGGMAGISGSAGGSEQTPDSGTPVIFPRSEGAVTRIYGRSIVREGYFVGESKVKPWSGWWYPLRDPELFESADSSRPAPLQKYDEYVKKTRALEAGSAAFERDRVFNPNADSWEGLCNAWAIASLLEPEPVRGATVEGINFSVGDLKALMIKSYEIVDGLAPFGQRYNGDRESVYDDIFPDQFHRLLQAELFARGRPLIMDKEPGLTVWNFPLWRATFQIVKDPDDPRTMHVQTEVLTASPYVNSTDFVGTLPLTFIYTYDLHGIPQPDGSLEVEWGEWTGPSMDFHPDFVVALPENRPVRRSGNTSISSAIVDEILTKARAP